MVKFGIGQSVTRKEDDRLIQGKGCYTDDIQLPDMTHAVFLRSPYAHAKITQIDCEDAKSMPGVLLILQYSDLAALDIGHIPCFITIDNVDGSDHYKPPRPLLADGVVRHVGDPVAMIVAETAAQAIDAMEAIQVEYEELPASITMDAALSADATPIWPKLGSNLGFHWQKGDRSATDTAFAKAAKTVTLDLVNNRIIANSLEPRNAVGDYADGRYTLYSGSQGVHQLKNQISNMILKIDSDLLRVVTPEVGGGFGMKIFVYNEQPLVLIAAQKIGRPVKWNGERSRDAFLSDAQGRDHQTRCEMALDGDNRFLGMRVHTKANMGGHYSNFAPFIPTDCGSHMLVGVYDIPAIHVEVQGVFTNTVPVDAYRGAGRPEATYVIERLVDYCAQSLKVDRMTLRHINFHKTFPAPTAMGTIYDSGNFDAVLEKGLKQVGYHDFEERRAKAKARGMLRGLGIAYYIESCGKGAGDSTRIKVQDDGRLQVFVGTQTNGQGHETAFSQIIADQLGVPIHSVDVIMGDSDLIPTGAGTGGSRSIPEVGSALLNTTKTLIDKA
ncbi:MAG: xanthine dehydrogenase family protein molybdopterin-binding subunit, partial [Pseudomonadota bacterium]